MHAFMECYGQENCLLRLYKLMHKDIKIAEKEIKKIRINLPLSKEMFKQFQKGHEKGLDEDDFCSLVKLLEEEANVKVEK